MPEPEKTDSSPPFDIEELPSDEQVFQDVIRGEMGLAAYKTHMAKVREEERGKDPLIKDVWGITKFEKRLGEYLEKGVRGALVAVDVDNFKFFNDTQGHPAGDELLKLTAKILREQARTHKPTAAQLERRKTRFPQLDLVARAGDEFLVFMVGAEADDSIDAAVRMRKAIAQEAKTQFPNFPAEQTMSLGVTLTLAEDDVKTLRQRADLALYEGKKGKGSQNPLESVAIL